MQTQDIAKIIYDAQTAMHRTYGKPALPAFEDVKSGILENIDVLTHLAATPKDLHDKWLKEKAADGWGHELAEGSR